MLATILLILKIIGIILAVILGILIVLLCLVLFVPLRYRGNAAVIDTVKDAKADFSVTWLLRLAKVLVTYEKTIRIRVKILFFTLLDTGKEKKPHRRKKKKEMTDIVNEESGAVGKEDVKNAEEKTAEEKTAERDEAPVGDEGVKQEENTAQETKEEQKNQEDNLDDKHTEKKNIKQRISDILYTIRNFCDKLKEVKDKGVHIKDLLGSDPAGKSLSLLWKELLYLLKHIKPRRIEGRLEFGFADPSATGYAMAAYGILYPAWNPKLVVLPDFEKEALHCQVKMKGRIRGIHFLIAALALLLSKDVKYVRKEIKSI